MALVVAIQPDRAQAATLRDALRASLSEEVLVVDSAGAALTAIEQQLPDLVLLYRFIPPREEDYFLAYLRTMPGTTHIQTITLPHLGNSSDCPPRSGLRSRPLKPQSMDLRVRGSFLAYFRSKSRTSHVSPPYLEYSSGYPARSRFLDRQLKPQSIEASSAGCDPRVFAADVARYLECSRAIKQEVVWRQDCCSLTRTADRREQRRWSARELPWVASVRLAAGEWADLIDVSSGGARVRTQLRPQLSSLKRNDLDSPRGSGLTFQLASGGEVWATGQAVRCQVGSIRNGPVLYEVAFRFDESVGLDLPSHLSLVPCREVRASVAADNALAVAPSVVF